MRSPPSAIDEELLVRLGAEGYATSAAQLERWRGHGLLPRNRQRSLGRGRGSASSHPEGIDILELARDLARLSTRKQPWQALAIGLFELGWCLPAPLLQTAGSWLLDRDSKYIVRLIRSAQRDGSLDDHDLTSPHALAAAIAHRHRDTRSLRPWLRTARDLARLDHPEADKSELAQLATDYLAAVLAERLGDYTVMADAVMSGTRHPQGIHGTGTERPAVSIWALRTCAATLSEDEAEMARDALLVQLQTGASNEGHSLLYLAISVVTHLRMEEFGEPSRKVPAKTLHERLGVSDR